MGDKENEERFGWKEAVLMVILLSVVVGAVAYKVMWGEDYSLPSSNFSNPTEDVKPSNRSGVCVDNCLNVSGFEDKGNISPVISNRWRYSIEGGYKHYVDNITVKTSVPVVLGEDCSMRQYSSEGNQTVIFVECEE